MKRIQLYVDDAEYAEIEAYAEASDRTVGNLTYHALRQHMKRYRRNDGKCVTSKEGG